MHNYLTLYVSTTKQKKSFIIREFLEHWYSKQEIKLGDLIQAQANQFELEWLQIKTNNENPSFENFIQHMRSRLWKKDIDEDIIEQIINKVKR